MKKLLLFISVALITSNLWAQADTIITSPPLTPNNGQSGVTFEFESNQPVNIVNLENVFSTGAISADLWMRVGGVQHTAGSPPNITTANGWAQVITGATVTGANNTNRVLMDFGGAKIAIPANTRIGFHIAGATRYQTGTAADQTTFTDGVGSVIVDDNAAYGGALPSPTFNPRRFVGAVIYEIGITGNCTPFTNFLIDSISGTVARVGWTPGAGNNSFGLEYGPAGFTRGTGTLVTGTHPGTQPPVILTGLSASTTYDVYFEEYCNAGTDTAGFPGPQTFTTTKLCAPPNSLAISNILATSVDVSWSYPGSATDFDIIYGPVGFDPTTTGTSVTVISSPYNLTGLNPATSYDAYLVANCGLTSGYSDTIGPEFFFTNCAITAAPFTEKFDDPTWVASGNNNGNSLNPCWSATPDMASATVFKWIPRGTGPTSGNGPLSDYTGGNFLYCEASGATAGNIAELVTPLIDVSTLTTPALYFMQHRFGAGTQLPAPLDVEVSNDFGTTWTNVYNVNGTQQASSGAPWELVFVNLGGYIGDTIQLKFIQTSVGCCADGAIDSVVVDEAPLCPWPTQLAVTGLSDTSATVNWDDPTGSSWDIEWGPCGYSQGTGTFATTSNKPYTATGLGANTCYDLYIRANCSVAGNGNSIWIGPISFNTQCAGFTAPYFANFDGTAAPALDNCWTAIEQGIGTSEVGTDAFRNYSAPNSLEIHNEGSLSGMVAAVSPRLDDLDNTKQISMFLYDEDGQFDGSDLIIGTMTNPLDTSTFTPYDTITEADMDDDVWEFFVIQFNNYTGTDKYIAFVHGMNSTFDNIHIDDFSYSVIPSCNPPIITSLGVSGTGATTASVFWGSGSDGDETHIEWGTAGFIPGTGSYVGLDSVPGTVDQYTITGLNPQTSYEYYIADSCAGGSFSPWVGPISFITQCNVLTAPLVENFDGTSWLASGNNAGNQLDVCWSSTPDVSQGTLAFKWIPRSTAPTSGNGPLTDLTGGNFMYCEASGAATGQVAYLYSPLIDLSALTAPALYFWQHRYYTTTTPPAPMDIEVTNDNGVTWTNVYNVSGNLQSSNSAPWEDEIVNLPQFVGDTIQIRFVQTSVGCCGDAAIDSVAIAEGPSCPDPAGVQAKNVIDTAATFSWFGAVQAGTHEVWFGPQGFFQGTTTGGGTKVFVTGGVDSLLIDTLSAASCYEFLVRGICGPGDTSNWVGPISFCTQCRPFPMPYVQSFDVWPPICWDVNLGTVAWRQFLVGSDGWADANFWGNSTGNMIMNSPPILVNQDGRLRYTWSHLANLTSYPNDELIVRVSVAGSGVWDTLTQKISILGNFNDPTAGNTSVGTGIEDIFNLDPLKYTGQLVVVQFWGNTDFGPNCYINDFNIEPLPACPRPQNSTVVSIGPASTDVTWTPGTTGATNWVVEYGSGDWISGTGTFIGSFGSANDTATISGLSANTNYCWRVAEICPNGTDTSLFTPLVCFNTPCQAITAPYFEDFSGNTIGHWDGEDNCWDFISNNPSTSSSGGYSWEVRNTSQTTSGSGTGPDRDNTLWPAMGGSFITADVSGSSGTVPDSTILLSPVVDISGLTVPEMQYHIHRLGTIMADLYVDINDGTGWVNGVHSYTSAAGIQSAQGDAWSDYIISLAPYAGSTNLRVRFRSVSNGCCAGDNAIDDVSFRNAPTCPQPQAISNANVAATSVDINWTAGTTGNTNFELAYGVGLTIGNINQGTIVNVTGTTYNITSLLPASNYCAFVREICAVGDTSLWTGPTCFNTLCPPVIMAPYTTDFENLATGIQSQWDNCWSSGTVAGPNWQAQIGSGANQGSTNTGPFYDATTPGVAGGTYMYLETSTGAGQHDLLSPYIDVSALANAQLEYYYHMYGATMATLEVYAEDQQGNRTFLDSIVGQQMTAGSDPFLAKTVALGAVPASIFRLVFVGIRGTSFTGDMAIDEVSVSDLGGCPVPNNLASSSQGCDSITVTWNSATGGSILAYGPQGFVPPAGTLTGIVTSPFTITGLSSGTAYDIYVSDTCSGDTSIPIGPVTVSTSGVNVSAAFTVQFGTAGPASRTVFFDASTSVGAVTYDWDFGDGTTGTGQNTSNIYTANGSYIVTLTVGSACGVSSITDTVVVGGIGLAESILNQTLEIYPNPAKTQVNISFNRVNENARVALLDLSGKELMVREISNAGDFYSGSFDLSELSDGVYMLQISDGDIVVNRRLIKR